MQTDKIKLKFEHCKYIESKRKMIHRSAQSISRELGKSNAWLGQIEHGRITSIKQADLINLLSILRGICKEEIVHGDFVSNFRDMKFGECPISWYDNVLFDDYNKYEDIEIHERITLLIDEIKEKVLYETNRKELYAFLRALETMQKNIDFSLELTSLINSLEFFNLHSYFPEYMYNYKRKMIYEYDKLHEIGIKNGSCGIITYEAIPAETIALVINELLSKIEDAQNILSDLVLDASNREKQVTYCRLAHKIIQKNKNYQFSKYTPYTFKYKDISSEITDNLSILFELKKDMNKHKHDAEKGLDYIIHDVFPVTFDPVGIGYNCK